MIKPVSAAAVVQIPIEKIIIGARRRERLGKVQRLATSIQQHGLIHPILLRGLTLVAGHRRLEACRTLQWKTIPARQVEYLTDDELRAIELEENSHREALSDYATSKARLAEIRQAEADLKTAAELRGTIPRKTRGRPKKATSTRAVAEAVGVDKGTVRNTEKHVALAERYPALQRTGWVQHHVLEAGTVLDKLPERDRSRAAALIDQDAIPPKKAIGILSNLAAMPADDRRDVFALAQSSDHVERQTALTKAAALPPPVDPGLTLLGDAQSTLQRAAKQCRCIEIKPQIDELAIHAARVYADFQEVNTNARRTVSRSHAQEASNGGDPRTV